MNHYRLKLSGTHFKQMRNEVASGSFCIADCSYRSDPVLDDILVKSMQCIRVDELPAFMLRFSDEQRLKASVKGARLKKSIYVLFAPTRLTHLDLEKLVGLPEATELYWCQIEGNNFPKGYPLFPHNAESAINSWFVAGDDYLFSSDRDNIEAQASTELSLRHQQMFGEETTRKLRGMKIGVVGCSGTGGPTIEQLARLGVGHLVLIDPDKVEHKNLNRIPNTMIDDAVRELKKVHVQERAISAIGYKTKVDALSIDLVTPAAIKAIASCDVVFGCMDSVMGRHVLNRIASHYLIPLIDVGVKLSADGKGGISAASGAVHCIQPGRSSLMSRALYDSEDLRADSELRENPEMYRQHRKEGYIKNVQVDSPAVISFNMQIAALGVTELLARIHPSMRLDSNDQYAILRMNWMDAQLVKEPEPESCSIFSKLLGRGDCVPLLGMPSLSRSREASFLKVGEHVESLYGYAA
jgi:molybdopterin/thiamine biosynthesis adenylyltransferase